MKFDYERAIRNNSNFPVFDFDEKYRRERRVLSVVLILVTLLGIVIPLILNPKDLWPISIILVFYLLVEIIVLWKSGLDRVWTLNPANWA